MGEKEWEVVYESNGQFEAEMLRGMLEAQEIPVVLSQEGLGRVYGLTLGTLGRVQILVPVTQLEAARRVLQDYESGNPNATDFPESDDPDMDGD